MGTCGDLPIILADAVQFAGCAGVVEGHDGMIPDAASEDVPEQHDRVSGRIERETEPAAFASVVRRHLGLRVSRTAIL